MFSEILTDDLNIKYFHNMNSYDNYFSDEIFLFLNDLIKQNINSLKDKNKNRHLINIEKKIKNVVHEETTKYLDEYKLELEKEFLNQKEYIANEKRQIKNQIKQLKENLEEKFNENIEDYMTEDYILKRIKYKKIKTENILLKEELTQNKIIIEKLLEKHNINEENINEMRLKIQKINENEIINQRNEDN